MGVKQSFSSKKEHRLRVCEIKALKRTLVIKKEEINENKIM
jgi:hypothetical protein